MLDSRSTISSFNTDQNRVVTLEGPEKFADPLTG